MRKTSRVVTSIAIAAASAGLMVATAPAASAERGESGCFGYSYEPGTMTTTVYYSNRCSKTRTLYIQRVGNDGWCDSTIEIRVPGKSKGNEVVRCGEVNRVVGQDK
ncbi:hypothetical protein [Nocardia cyriacigeorgica]|uniref:hypothetical protein n=1 Tax=Nocardia cyriacigeorgica TaxID=135487 RepID=UPI00245586A1|nr:hypothetical protein [Nocardia cyriacigeorgica]